MNSLNICTERYRFSFNGKDCDNEVKGVGNSVDFGARVYDSRLGRWLSIDPNQHNYPFLSPYNAFEDNPIYFNDPDGKDAVATIHGNTMTISAKIFIGGHRATAAKAVSIQNDIMGYWNGKDFKYRDNAGKEYNVKFDIQVVSYDNKNAKELAKNAIETGEYNQVVLIDEKSGGEFTSNVSNVEPVAGWYGHWGEDEDAGTYAHETGHLLGFDDLYYLDENGKAQNYQGVDENELLGKRAHEKDAQVTQKDINAIGDHVVNNQKNGKTKIDAGTSHLRDKNSLSKQNKPSAK